MADTFTVTDDTIFVNGIEVAHITAPTSTFRDKLVEQLEVKDVDLQAIAANINARITAQAVDGKIRVDEAKAAVNLFTE